MPNALDTKRILQTVLEKMVIKDKQKKGMSVSHEPAPWGCAVLPELFVLNGDQYKFHTMWKRNEKANCVDRSVPLLNEKKIFEM